LSKVLKPGFYVEDVSGRLIEPTVCTAVSSPLRDRPAGGSERGRQLGEMEERLLRDAETAAQELLARAAAEADRMREDARREIAQWWAKRREEDERVREEAREAGYRQGYAEGAEEARRAVHQEYAAMLAEAAAVVEQAARMKRQMIAESEPFLVELSVAIAEKIISRQLTLERRWVIDLVREQLARRKETGTITVCVAPRNFELLREARSELRAAVDSRAELIIVPDSSVRDDGCVIRSDFGSVDARVETQLSEIRRALLAVAAEEAGAG